MVLIRSSWKRGAECVFVLGVLLLLFHQTLSKLSGRIVVWPQSSARRDAYAFYATQDAYAYSAAVNIHRLRHVFNTKHRIIVLVSSDVSREYLSIFSELEAIVFEEIPPPLPPGSAPYYKDCLLKLLAFKIHELDPSVRRSLTLDSDQLIVKNIDSIFESPSIDPAAPPAYWLGNDTLASTCMLIEPSPSLWDQVQQAIISVSSGQYDMDIVNEVFQDHVGRLPGSYVTLNSHWEDRNVPIWFGINSKVPFPIGQSARHASDEELEELYIQSHIIHFTAIGKPWMRDTDAAKKSRPDAHPVLFQ